MKYIYGTLAAYFIFMIFVCGAAAAESFASLERRVNLSAMTAALQRGDNRSFAALPAKGYSNGLTGLLVKYNVYPNPEYSFTSCSIQDKYAGKPGMPGMPGCLVSLKLARKLPNGSVRDFGIRIEYAIAPGGKTFEPNNSVWAIHAVTGDGLLDDALTH